MKKQYHTYHYSPEGEIYGVCTASVAGISSDTFVVEDKVLNISSKRHGYDKDTKEVYEAEIDNEGRAVIASGRVKRKSTGKRFKIREFITRRQSDA